MNSIGKGPALRRWRRILAAAAAALLILPGAGGAEEKGEDRMGFNAETIGECVPFGYGYDMQMAEDKGLAENGEFTEEFFLMQNYYGEALFQYLDRETSLKVRDEALGQPEIRMIPRPEEDQDPWQKHQSYGMQYFYIRNDLCIEQLMTDHREQLLTFAREQWDPADEQVVAFIKETMPVVLMLSREVDPDEEILMSSITGKTLVNRALRICFASVSEYDENGYFVSAENEAIKSELLKAYLPQMQKEMSEALNYPVDIERITE